MSATLQSAVDVRARRIYDPPERQDGYRVLVDRLWPRGISRERAHLDDWVREVAPSEELRNWFDHDPARFATFRERYLQELTARSPYVDELRWHALAGRLTLLYGARDTEHNHAVVLVDHLRGEAGV